jgi:methylenetetrahydrofolate reductase (NADPH)
MAAGIASLLEEPRFELLPFESIDEQLEHLPAGADVAITTSPTLGLEATIEWTERAAARGYEPVPHVAARFVRDEAHLDSLARRLVEVGVTDIFVPGGDREEPVGEFASAYDLLSALEELEYGFDEVGITGYPEGHAFLDADELAESMARKEPYATYVVTQLCYDPDAIVSWITAIRDRGVDLPVEIGVPGVLSSRRLFDISKRVGVGDSIRFLRQTSGFLGFVRRLVGARGTYTPIELVERLAPYAADTRFDIRGLHVYTFNQVPAFESWRTSTLAEYR